MRTYGPSDSRLSLMANHVTRHTRPDWAQCFDSSDLGCHFALGLAASPQKIRVGVIREGFVPKAGVVFGAAHLLFL
jgi:hypothetical protein